MARFKAEKRKALERKAAKEAAKKARLEEEARGGQSTSQAPSTQPTSQSQLKSSNTTSTASSGPILSEAVQAVKAAEENYIKLASSTEEESNSKTHSETLAAQLKAIETLTEISTKDLPPSIQSAVKEKLAVQQARITAQQLLKQTRPPVSIPGLGELDKVAPQQPGVPRSQVPPVKSPSNQVGLPRGPSTPSTIPMGFRAQLAAGLVRGAQTQPTPPRGVQPQLQRPRGALLGHTRGVQSQPVPPRGTQPGHIAPARLGMPPQVTGSIQYQQRGVVPSPNLRGPPPAFPNMPVMRTPSVPPSRPLFPISTQVTVAASTFQRAPLQTPISQTFLTPRGPPPQTPISQTYPTPRGPPPQIPISQTYPTPRGPPPQIPVSQSLDYYIQRTPVSYQTPTSKQHTNIQAKNSTEEATHELEKMLSKDNKTKKGFNKKGPQPKLAFNVKKIESPKQIQPVPVSRLVVPKEKASNKSDEKSQRKEEETAVKVADNLFGKVIDPFNKLQKDEEKNVSDKKIVGKDIKKDARLSQEIRNRADIINARIATSDKKGQTEPDKKRRVFSELSKESKEDSKSRRERRKSRFESRAEGSKKDTTAEELERDKLMREDHQRRRRREMQQSPVKLITRSKLLPSTDKLSTGSRSPVSYSRRSPGRRSPDRLRQEDIARTRLSPEYYKDRSSSGRKSPTRMDTGRDSNRSRFSPDRYHDMPPGYSDRSRGSSDYKERGSSGRRSPTRMDTTRDLSRYSSPGHSLDRSRISSDRSLKSGRSPERYRNMSPPREHHSADLHSPGRYGSSGRAYRSPDRHGTKRSPERDMGYRYPPDTYDSRGNLSPYSYSHQSRRSPSPYSHRGQEMFISRSPVRYPNIPSSTRLSPRRSNSPPPFRKSRSRSPMRYHNERHSRSISPDQRSRRSPDPRLRRSRSPDHRLRRSQSPVQRSRRSLSPRYRRSPDQRSRRSLTPDGRYRRSPDPRSRRSLSPDHRSKRSRSPRDMYRGQQTDGQIGGINMQTPNLVPNQYGNIVPLPNFNQIGNQFSTNIPPPNINPIGNQFGQTVNPGNAALNPFNNPVGNLGPNQFSSNFPPPNSGSYGNLPLNPGPYGNVQPSPGPYGNPPSSSGPYGNPPPNFGGYGNPPTNVGPGQLGNQLSSSGPGQFGNQLSSSAPGQFGNQITSSAPDQSMSSVTQQSSLGPNQQTNADAKLMPPPSTLKDRSPPRSTSTKPGDKVSTKSLSQGATGPTSTAKPPVLKGILKKKSDNPPASESSTASSIWQSLTGTKETKSEPQTKRFTSGALSTLQESYKEPTGIIPSHIVQKLQEWLPGLGDNLISGLKDSLDQVKSNEGQLNRNNNSHIQTSQGQQQQFQGQQDSKSKEISFGQHRYVSEPKNETFNVMEQGQKKTHTGMEDTYESFLNVIGYEKKTESTKQSPTPHYMYNTRRDSATSSIPGLDIPDTGGNNGDRFKKPTASSNPGLFSSSQQSGGMARPLDSMAGPHSNLTGSLANKPVSSAASTPYYNAPISYNRPGVFPSAARLNQILRK